MNKIVIEPIRPVVTVSTNSAKGFTVSTVGIQGATGVQGIQGIPGISSGLQWETVALGQLLVANRGYIVDALSLQEFTLPTASNGSTIALYNVLSGFRVLNGSSIIRHDVYSTGIGGSVQTSRAGTLIKLQKTNTVWVCTVESGFIEIV